MSDFQFIVTPVLSPSTPLGELELSNVSFNDPVYGSGASFSGKLEVPAGMRDTIATLTEPWAIAMYVRDMVTGEYPFGGPLFERPWDPNERRLTLGAMSWKSWTYLKMLDPDFSVNPPVDKIYSMLASDQFSIARYILGFNNTDVGTPTIHFGSELSGVLRDFNTQGSQFKSLGDLVDSMANRDNGFNWNISIAPDSNGHPSLQFTPYWPTRGNVNNTVLLLHEEPTGGNILSFSAQAESAAALRTRCWATGSGQPPDMLMAYDQDPGLGGGFLLNAERVDNYSTVTDINTLAQHARTARKYYGQSRSTVTPVVALNDPDFRLYGSGDKVRLRIEDDWWDYDFSAVRIIDRQFNVNNSGDSSKVDSVSLTLDLTDIALPQDSEQV
jgi:hypothetical protein